MLGEVAPALLDVPLDGIGHVVGQLGHPNFELVSDRSGLPITNELVN